MLRRNINFILLSFVFDFLCIPAAVLSAEWLRLHLPYGNPISAIYEIRSLMLEAMLLYPAVFLLLSLYNPERTFRVVDEYQSVTLACLFAGLAQAGLVYFTIRDISRLYLVYFYLLDYLLLMSWRTVARLLRNTQNGRSPDTRKVLLIGGGEVARQTLERLHELAWAGVHLLGYLTDGKPIPSTNGTFPYLGSLAEADRIVRQHSVDDVLIALPAESYLKLQQLVTVLIDKPCNIWIVPDYFSLLIYGSRVADLGQVSMISLKAPALSGYQRMFKRAFDLVVGTTLQMLVLPMMGVIAIAIKLDSPGPVIFKQKRVGENGRLFLMYKFRTMVAGAEERMEEVIQRDADGHLVHKFPDDPRITRLGRFLRRTSLDELPQFINVLKGEMSLVGPRPEMPILVEQYQQWQLKRLAVPQGITGWWQVNGRSDKPMHLHTEDDLYYIQNYSLLLDLQICLKTGWVILRGKGAY
jgi:exopolysaccharide biosynthesis polyprenyl glycosylphosphotransferase